MERVVPSILRWGQVGVFSEAEDHGLPDSESFLFRVEQRSLPI